MFDLSNLDNLPEFVFSRSLAPEQYLFHQNDPATALYIVASGRLQVSRITCEERNLTLQIARPGDLIGERALFKSHHDCFAIAEVPSRVLIYPKPDLQTALRTNPTLAEELIALVVQNMQALEIRFELYNIRAARERVLRYLRHRVRRGGRQTVILDRPFKDIAAELGLTPETLSRALKKLEREGAIARDRYQISLEDLSA